MLFTKEGYELTVAEVDELRLDDERIPCKRVVSALSAFNKFSFRKDKAEGCVGANSADLTSFWFRFKFVAKN
jgi:hypothetical protein